MRASDEQRRVSDSELLRAEAESVLNRIKSSLDSAYIQGDGFSCGLEMPYQIYGYDYSVEISGGFAAVRCGDISLSRKLLPVDIAGSISPGNNTITNTGDSLVIA